MIYILNIGYESFAFANSRGLQTVMDTLSKARKLKRHYYQGCEKEDLERLDLADGAVEIGMHVVNGVSFVSGKSKREVIEPEVLPRQRDGEGDAMFAMRATKRLPSATATAAALSVIRREKLAGELRRMIGEGK